MPKKLITCHHCKGFGMESPGCKFCHKIEEQQLSQKTCAAAVAMLSDEIKIIERTIKNIPKQHDRLEPDDFESMWKAQIKRLDKIKFIIINGKQ